MSGRTDEINDLQNKEHDDESQQTNAVSYPRISNNTDVQRDTLSQERSVEEERLTELQQMKEELPANESAEEELQKRLMEANKEIGSLKRQNEEQYEKMKAYEADIEKLTYEKDDKNEELFNEDEIEELKKEVHSLHEKLDEAIQEKENLKTQIEERSGTSYQSPDHTANHKTDHHDAMSGRTQEMNDLKNEEYHDESQQMNTVLYSRILNNSDVEREYTSYEQLIRHLNNEIHLQQEKMKAYEVDIEKLTSEKDEKIDENGCLMHRIMQLEDQLKEMEAKAASLEEELFREDETEKLKKEIHSLNETLSQERNIGEKRLSENQQMKEELVVHKSAEEELNQKLANVSEEMENLKRKIEEQSADNGGILHKYLEGEQAVEKLKEKLAQAESEATAAKEQHEGKLSKVYEELHKLTAQSNQEKEKLQQQINKLTDENRRLRNHILQTTNELEGKKVENKSLESELTRTKRELEVIKNERTHLDGQILQLSAELNDRDTKIMGLNADITQKETEKTFANECMQRAVKDQQEMMYQISNLRKVEMEKSQAEQERQFLLDENTRLRACLEESSHLRNYLQQYYKVLQDTQLELQREKEKSRHINELFSTNGQRLDSKTADLRNYRSAAENNRRLLEEKKDFVHGLQRQIDQLTFKSETLQQERDRYHQESFELNDRCQRLTEELEQTRNESRELREQADAADGTNENTNPNQADNGGILHKYLEGEQAVEKLKVSLEKLKQENLQFEIQLRLKTEKLAQAESEATAAKEQHEGKLSKVYEELHKLTGHFANLFTSTPAGPQNASFQSPGFFAQGSGGFRIRKK